MTEQLLKKIIPMYAGQNSEKLVDLLYKKRNVNEFLISKKMNLTINQTRNMLYKLADEGLVSFIRKKDKKKGGWYTYFWSLNIKRSLNKFKEKIEENISSLNERLKNLENERYFHCKYCDLDYTEEDAIINEYKCKECGEVLEIKDNTQAAIQIKKEIEKLNQNLEIISKEVHELEKKEKKDIEKKDKKEKEEKELERKKVREARLKLKKKEEKKDKKKKTSSPNKSKKKKKKRK